MNLQKQEKAVKEILCRAEDELNKLITSTIDQDRRATLIEARTLLSECYYKISLGD